MDNAMDIHGMDAHTFYEMMSCMCMQDSRAI